MGQPHISVQPSVSNNQLYASCRLSPGFFDDDMRESLLSGMSSNLNFQLTLSGADGSMLRSKMHNIQLRYDIWEKKYYIYNADEIHQFSEQNEFEIFLSDSLNLKLGSVKTLDKQKKLRIIVLFSPQKITHNQQKKLNYWLTNAGETEESKPGLESESGFSIDVSRLFSIFLRKKPAVKTLKFYSPFFNIQGLMTDEISSQ
jgi:hypothetical protein